ncbi:hypothetical protein IMY05_005G0064700 [Salix suchowensis]|nr:hypothetical protein IMY05_005G0064700 [Salix suchowensis]
MGKENNSPESTLYHFLHLGLNRSFTLCSSLILQDFIERMEQHCFVCACETEMGCGTGNFLTLRTLMFLLGC